MQIETQSRTNPTSLPKAKLSAALLLAGLLVAASAPAADAAQGRNILSDLDIIPTIESIDVVDGQLIASGTATAVVNRKIVTAPFSTTVDIRLAEPVGEIGILQTACPILDLELGPIYLDLLGLIVETSPICLQITAYQSEGLLGDLLCAVANLLAGGLSLEDILAGIGLAGEGDFAIAQLGGLLPDQINQLLGGLTDLLNQALQNLRDAILERILPGFGRNCPILQLELGPLELTLLGLEVILDDCAGGPVTVDITAQRGGGLLGNLLCGLLGGLDALLGQPLWFLILVLVLLI
jgi:hypothetical protein